ncbi:MAG: hypothetical protein R3F19_26945 [Verrucomicrobiales bacterium]
MPENEEAIIDLESKFPQLSGVAFATARQEVLQAGRCVLIAENGIIYRVFPDGRREVVKHIDPPTQVKTGRTITIR